MLRIDSQSIKCLFRDVDQIICKTYMTRVEGENTRLRHYLARLHRKTLCYSKSKEMLGHSVKLLIHYLKFWDVPVPVSINNFSRARSRKIE
jgi:insertion element IS1 protein InsB